VTPSPEQTAAAILQLVLGAVFLLSVLPKLRDPSSFVRAVERYGLLPAGAVPATAFAVIAIEVFLAGALLTGSLAGIALPLTILLLVAFLVAVWINLDRGRKVPCGCFGDRSEIISGRVLVRLVLLLIAATLLTILNLVVGVDLRTPGALGLQSTLGIAGLAAFVIIASLWLLSLPELVALAGAARATRATNDQEAV
jgi:methylamine utilization protein MauE